MLKWFKKDDENAENNGNIKDRYTKRYFKITVIIFIIMACLFSFSNLMLDKISCAYTGYTYEKPTKRPIFSQCLIQMKDGSFVPLERYINRVMTFNDLGNGE